jgi:glutathione S-transferase
MTRLYTFVVSHFAEKARWALDWKGVEYAERQLTPGLHRRVLRSLGAPGGTVPVLQDEDRVTQGSAAIIDYADRRWPDRPLTPADPALQTQAAELEHWLDAEVGEPLRRVFYASALDSRELVVQLFTQGGAWWAPWFFRWAYPRVAGIIRKMYAITPGNVAGDRVRLDAAFARIEQLLARGDHLVGDRFSRADLTLAALIAPLWAPPEHCTRWPPEDLYPQDLRELRARLAGRRARDWTLRMYRAHRAAPSGRPGAASA